MSSKSEAAGPVKKPFGKEHRHVPHHSSKAKRWYPAEDATVKRKVCGILEISHCEDSCAWLEIS